MWTHRNTARSLPRMRWVRQNCSNSRHFVFNPMASYILSKLHLDHYCVCEYWTTVHILLEQARCMPEKSHQMWRRMDYLYHDRTSGQWTWNGKVTWHWDFQDLVITRSWNKQGRHVPSLILQLSIKTEMSSSISAYISCVSLVAWAVSLKLLSKV